MTVPINQRMKAIRSRGNKTTERRMRSVLLRAGVRGWEMHCSELPGKPDFVFRQIRLALFVDGCFWHGCHKCGHVPRQNRTYWSVKLMRNRARDVRVRRELKRLGWTVVRVWEHELSASSNRLTSLLDVLSGSKARPS